MRLTPVTPQDIDLPTTVKGISVRGLRKLAAIVERRCMAGLFEGRSYEKLTSSEVVYLWIKLPSTTGFKRLADCDLIEGDVGGPLYFISHAWGGSFKRLVDTTLSYLKDASDDTFIWLDIVSVNQHNDPDDPSVGTPFSRAQNTADVSAFEEVIKATVGTLVAVDFDNSDPSSRAWCLFEWDHTLTHHGPSGLHFTGTTPWQLQAMVQAIDVEKASCFKPNDKAMIIEKVISHHGSTDAFNTSLRLQLLLDPLSYKVDMNQLLENSRSTEWAWRKVLEWIHCSKGPSSRALCIMAGAWAGKSTISAAMCSQLLSPMGHDGIGIASSALFGFLQCIPRQVDVSSSVVAAWHFIKYSDQRRLDPVRIIKSLSFQLAKLIPSFAAKLLLLDAAKINQLSDWNEAFDLLLAGPLAGIDPEDSSIILLFDALDEGDPLEQQEAGFKSKYPAPVANQVMYLITRLIEKLPLNVRFIFTSRPDAVSGAVRDILSRSFGINGVLYVKPSELCASKRGGQDRVMTFNTLVERCNLAGFQPLSSTPAMQDVHRVYQAVFERIEPSESVRSLLDVIAAAREPLTMQQLASLGLEKDLPSLPGWSCLFNTDEHRVFLIHKSLSDWLRNASLSNKHAVNESNGHAILGTSLLRDIVQATDAPGSGSVPVDASEYALKYSVFHICKALSSGRLDIKVLNTALGKWEFLRQVFGRRQGGKLVKALGEWHTSASIKSHSTSNKYAEDALYCMRRHFNDWEDRPDEMETVALTSPLGSFKYKEAHSRLKISWVVDKVLGGLEQDDWPADRIVLKGHSHRVLAVSFSPDGKYLASGSGDKTARIWDLASGQSIVTLNGHSDVVTSVSFSPNSKFLASGSDDKTAKIWDLASGQNTATLQGHLDWVTSVSFSPDGSFLSTGSTDKTARIWDLANGKCTATLLGHHSAVTSVSFSSNKKSLATGSVDMTAKVWDMVSGQCTATLRGHSDEVTSVSFSPNGAYLASGSNDKTAKIWDLANGQNTATLQGHSHPVISVAFSSDNKYLASGSGDKTAMIWDLSSCQCIVTLNGHSHHVMSVSFSPDGKLLATGSHNKTARIWDLVSGHSTVDLQGHSHHVSSVSFSPNNKLLATGSYDKTARVWDRVSSACLLLEGHSHHVTSVSFNSDNSSIASGSADMSAKIWDLVSGQCTATLQGHSDWVTSVSFSPNNKFLGTGSHDNTARIWDLATGQSIFTLQGHTRPLSSVSFSPDRMFLATGSNDKTARIWDLSSGQNTVTLQGHANWVSSVAFSPDGKSLATGSTDKTARVWDLASGQCIVILQGHSHNVMAVSFSPDGKLLATGSHDKSAKLWNLVCGQCTTTLQGHSDEVTSVSFSPDSDSLATGSTDKTARIWDLARRLENGRST